MSLKKSTPFIIFFGVLLLDIFSKLFVVERLVNSPYEEWVVFKQFLGINFSIVHATNKGAAWGLFSNWQQLLLYFRITLIIFLSFFALFFNKKRSLDMPIALILAGAVGNVLDYFIYGHVIDMFYFNFWGYDYPVFNIADSSIFIGIFWMIVLSFYS